MRAPHRIIPVLSPVAAIVALVPDATWWGTEVAGFDVCEAF